MHSVLSNRQKTSLAFWLGNFESRQSMSEWNSWTACGRDA